VDSTGTFRFAAQMAALMKIEKSRPAFKGQTTGEIATNLYRCDQKHLYLWSPPARSASLQKMA
jgi:hypothetical protein